MFSSMQQLWRPDIKLPKQYANATVRCGVQACTEQDMSCSSLFLHTNEQTAHFLRKIFSSNLVSIAITVMEELELEPVDDSGDCVHTSKY